MSKYRNKLLDEIVRIYGLENEITIEFARLCENLPENNNFVLEQLVKTHKETR